MQSYEKLELEFARWNGLDPAGMVAVNSGTSGLILALEALQIEKGSQVLTAEFNMIAVPRAITITGLVPVFADCEDNLNISQRTLLAAPVTRQANTLLAVHIYGRALNEDVFAFAEERGLTVVEDLAEVHGVKPHRTTAAAVWSTFKNKIVQSSEGGMVWFRDPNRADLARSLKNLGFTPAHDYRHVPGGYNFRLADHLAEIGLQSLDQVDDNLKRRRELEAYATQLLVKLWKSTGLVRGMPERDSPWVMDFRIPSMIWKLQDELIRSLQGAGVPARHAFKPMSEQEEFSKADVKSTMHDSRKMTNARRLSNEVMYIPLTPSLVSELMLDTAFAVISSTVEKWYWSGLLRTYQETC